MRINDKIYDVLKWIAIIVLPALATACGGLGNTWGLPYSEQIVTTINIFGTFLGAVICVSSVGYGKDK